MGVYRKITSILYLPKILPANVSDARIVPAIFLSQACTMHARYWTYVSTSNGKIQSTSISDKLAERSVLRTERQNVRAVPVT